MFEIFKQNITVDKLREDEAKLPDYKNNDKVSSYLISYPEFLAYFENLVAITKHNLIVGIHFTYGWMPTIFDFRSTELDEVTAILNLAKNGHVPTESELELMRSCLNNSLVGVSKLLHFINPSQFAIWDSKVYCYLTGKTPHSYRLDQYKSYLSYLKFCDFITSQKEFKPIHESVIKKVGYNMTSYRTLELIMFANGGQSTTEKD